ncbi:MAG: metal ABC transporter ATP-binding protein [bacterium]|nr:metal ABC transporter ATP-binding protein [bacterium]
MHSRAPSIDLPVQPARPAPRGNRESVQPIVGGQVGAAITNPMPSDPITPPPLRVSGLTLAYGDERVLDDIQLELPTSQLIAIVGPNGAGKSSLLRSVLGLAQSQGNPVVEFFGQRLTEVRRRIAFMPQRERVDWNFPTRVVDVVTMGLYGEIGWLRRIRGHHRNAALAALERVGMAELATRQIGELSGGQQKRVFLARTLVQGADLFLLDEPFAGVDARSEEIIARELQALRDAGSTVAVVHHDLTAVRRSFDYCVLLNRRVLAAGPVAEVLTAERVADAYDGVVPLALLDATRPETID